MSPKSDPDAPEPEPSESDEVEEFIAETPEFSNHNKRKQKLGFGKGKGGSSLIRKSLTYQRLSHPQSRSRSSRRGQRVSSRKSKGGSK